MNKTKKTNNNLINCLILVVLAFLFLLVFSNGTSPLTSNYYGMDSAFFMLFGKCMKNGMLPYIDLFDHKGPYFFWLQEFGQIICDGRIGAFIIQLISLSISMIIVDRIIQIKNNNFSLYKRLLFQMPLLIILSSTFREGNLTEEYALPFLFFSLYLFIKYLENNNKTNKPLYAFVYGMFIGIIAFARITNAAFICSIVLTTTICLIKDKEYKNLLMNIFSFILGIIISFIPIFIYFSSINGLDYVFKYVFEFAYKYSTNMSMSYRISNYFTIQNILYIISALFPIMFLLLINKTNTKQFLFSCISFVSTFLATFLGFSFTHYFVLVIPNVLFGIYLLLNNEEEARLLIKKKIVVFVCVLVLLGQSVFMIEALGKNVLQMFDYSISLNKHNYYSDIAKLDTEIGNFISNSEKDSVWGYGIKARFYLRTETYPCVKYFDYLDQFIAYDELKEEMEHLFINNEPKWMVISKEKDSIPDFINNVLISNYYLCAENEAYYLYNRK